MNVFTAIKITKYQNPTNKKTKIPVLLNQTPKAKGPETRNSRDAQKSGPLMLKNSVSNTRSSDRKVPGSLMNATKSSSAKIVPKVYKYLILYHSYSVIFCFIYNVKFRHICDG